MECPVCKGRMQHDKIESAWVDICPDHGIWLDKGEIEAIMETVRNRGESEGFVKSLWDHTH